ncbi:helix-turn-helix transcriptional regulator [Kitasatospora sp. NPDC057223]|uniref:helix-turn-helix transcriptional regulator n=1 Tax=Kitasatospora sp. NPDC057223 TaxID=3346055 RepID=UPI003625C371
MPAPPAEPTWVLDRRRQVGCRIRALREERRLSQEALAELAGISRHTMYRTETGARAASLDVVIRLAAALDVPLGQLFREL